jgi:hypothetical protein
MLVSKQDKITGKNRENCQKLMVRYLLTPAASDSTKQENRGSSCDGTWNIGTGGGLGAGIFWPK